MNKIAIPSLLLGVVMIAGAFAFMPVQEASTVHTSGTTTLAAGGIGVGDFATDAITADALAADAATEISNTINAADINIGSVDAGGLPVGVYATDAITADALAADATTEIIAGLMTVKDSITKTADAAVITAEGTSAFMVEFCLSDADDADATLTIAVEGTTVLVIDSGAANETNCATIGSTGGAAQTVTGTIDDGTTANSRATATLIGQIGDATLDLT